MSPDAAVMKLSPTASARARATVSGWLAVAVPPTVATVMGTGCVLRQASPAVGTTTVSSVDVALTTVAATPSTVTAVPVVPRKPVPRTIAVAPGVSVAGPIPVTVGATEPSGAVTAIARLPETPSLPAVIVVVPGLRAASCPLRSTVATSGADELNVTRLPTSTLPFRSVTTTASGVLSPATSGAAGGVIVTANTGGVATVTIAEPVFPSTLALIDAEPGAWAVTIPSPDTVAIDAFADAHASALPVMGAPAWSFTSAVSANDVPIRCGPAGAVTTTVATTGPGGSPGSEGPPSLQPISAASATVRVTNRIRRGPPRTGSTPHLAATIFGGSPEWRRPLKTATFETNRGTITAELYDEDAPKTVENFEKLANSGFYDGVKFHRVIPDFVVQGGDPYSRDLPDGDPRIGSGGPGWKIKCETAGNPRKHEVGALSMAHAGKDTGGSQFFMVLSEQNTRHLNGVHTVFGKITGGLDVMRQIKKNDVMNSVRVA